ncbi:MAG: aminoacyl-tRNA hydrolase [Anaerolineae bacterium]|nr:aminoacyl-tRNA hydrolase [Anaerolineae bacterium]
MKPIGNLPTQENTPYLIVGLGNPGREYRQNRHNVGFMAVDHLAQKLDIRISRLQSKALTGSGSFGGNKLVLAKPQTYMNLSGQSVSGLCNFYKVPLDHLLVIHDDLDLPTGTLRLRPSGGSGGQKGVASIIERLGTQDFARLRIGIGRPPGQMDPADYVLEDFTPVEREVIALTLERVVQAVLTFLRDGIHSAMNQYNGGLRDG